MNSSKDRVWEIDAARGIALLLMIVFHLAYNLKEFYGYDVKYASGALFYIGKLSGAMFIMISAVSSSFSRNNFRRGIGLLLAGMLITAVTHIYDPDYGIKFGILHFLGVSIMLYPALANLNKYILAGLGIMIIALGQYLGQITVEHNYLFLFNLTSGSWVSADYYPLVPWIGVFMIGAVLGRHLYPQRRSILGTEPERSLLRCIGRNTLIIYLIHQPVLILLIGIVKKYTGG